MTVERDQTTATPPTRTGPRWGLWLGLLAAAFLFGFVPMWLSSRTTTNELRETRRELRRSQVQNTLGSAVVDARRGEYEAARQAASRFFNEVSAELDNKNDSFLADQEKAQIGPALSSRDDIITLLSRSDPAATERLSELHVEYRKATSAP